MFFLSLAFLGLVGELAHKLGVSLDRHIIRDMVIEEAKIKRINLKELSTINVRFFNNNNQIITQILAVKDTMTHHTSQDLQKIVGVLEDLNIKKEQIV